MASNEEIQQAEPEQPQDRMVERRYFSAYVGPLPDPESLAAYEDAYEGAAEIIFRIAEKEQDHRHKLDTDSLAANVDDGKRDRQEALVGQLCALTIGVCAILTGGWVAVNGAQFPGAVIGATGVAGLIKPFVTGRQNQGSSDNQ